MPFRPACRVLRAPVPEGPSPLGRDPGSGMQTGAGAHRDQNVVQQDSAWHGPGTFKPGHLSECVLIEHQAVDFVFTGLFIRITKTLSKWEQEKKAHQPYPSK